VKKDNKTLYASSTQLAISFSLDSKIGAMFGNKSFRNSANFDQAQDSPSILLMCLQLLMNFVGCKNQLEEQA
jgi:hypothetical protein